MILFAKCDYFCVVFFEDLRGFGCGFGSTSSKTVSFQARLQLEDYCYYLIIMIMIRLNLCTDSRHLDVHLRLRTDLYLKKSTNNHVNSKDPLADSGLI